MQSNRRDAKIDIIKGIGICLMVLGHSGCPITHFIYLFHMPIFFIASGYVFNQAYTENANTMKTLIYKKIKSLWLPYAIVSIIYVALWNLFVKLGFYNENPMTFSGIIKECSKIFVFKLVGGYMPSAFWFIRCLFITTVIYAFIDYGFHKFIKNDRKDIYHIIVSIILFYVACIMRTKQISFIQLDVAFSAYFLLALGGILKRLKVHEFQPTYCIVAFLLSLMILLVCNEAGSIEMVKGVYTSLWFYIVSSIAGWFLLLSISNIIINSSFFSNIFIYLGKSTIYILAFHFGAFKIISYVQIKIYNLPFEKLSSFPVIESKPFWWLLYAFTGLTIPLAIKGLTDFLIKLTNKK